MNQAQIAIAFVLVCLLISFGSGCSSFRPDTQEEELARLTQRNQEARQSQMDERLMIFKPGTVLYSK